MIIIDTHAHLDHLENIDAALEAARETGVAAVVAVSETIEAAKKNLAIRERISSPRIFVACGVHPSEASLATLEDALMFLDLNVDKLAAVGEIGLDFWYKWVRDDEEKKNEQREVFRRHLEWAVRNDRPVVVHSRGAWRECCDMVKASGISRAVFHWYSGPLDVLDDILAAGYYISATPSLAYSQEARQAIQRAPIEQTLIETDTPVTYRNSNDAVDAGFSATPKDVFRTLSLYCAVKGMDPDSAAAVLNSNAVKLFGLTIPDEFFEKISQRSA